MTVSKCETVPAQVCGQGPGIETTKRGTLVKFRTLMLGSSLVAMGAVSVLGILPAAAQDAAANVEAVTVTGSRISIQGYEAPTPVTVIGAEQLERDAHMNIMDSIIQLPAVGLSETPNNSRLSADLSQGDASLSVVNLRNLGIARTLVLFDGQRVVSSNIFGGGVDLSTIPAELVKRVDVVTGGASAAYGSDAVAGVVNLILDKNFSGLKADFEGGDSTTVRHRQIKAELTVGTDILGRQGSPDPERRPYLEQRSGLPEPGRLVRQQRHRPEPRRDDLEQSSLVHSRPQHRPGAVHPGRPDPRQHRRRRRQLDHRQFADRNPVPQQRRGGARSISAPWTAPIPTSAMRAAPTAPRTCRATRS